MPALILGSQDQARRAQKDGPRGGIGREGPGKGPGAPNLTFSTIVEHGRARSSPWGDSLLRPATLPRTFIFLRNFTILASEPSNSIEISLFWRVQGQRLQGYPHQTLENLQAHPYCNLSIDLFTKMKRSQLKNAAWGFSEACLTGGRSDKKLIDKKAWG